MATCSCWSGSSRRRRPSEAGPAQAWSRTKRFARPRTDSATRSAATGSLADGRTRLVVAHVRSGCLRTAHASAQRRLFTPLSCFASLSGILQQRATRLLREPLAGTIVGPTIVVVKGEVRRVAEVEPQDVYGVR